MKHMNPKIAKLLHEGFSINTIDKLNDAQLSALYSRISEQTGTLNIPNGDTASIDKATITEIVSQIASIPVYVTETDITTKQRKVSEIETRSVIG